MATKTMVKAKSSSKKKKISEEDIRKKAEQIYAERIKAGIPGNDESDWLKAEKELRG